MKKSIYLSGTSMPYRGMYFEKLTENRLLPVYSSYPNLYIYGVVLDKARLNWLLVPLRANLLVLSLKKHPAPDIITELYFYTIEGSPDLHLNLLSSIYHLGVKRRSSRTEIELMKTFL